MTSFHIRSISSSIYGPAIQGQELKARKEKHRRTNQSGVRIKERDSEEIKSILFGYEI